MSDMLTDAAPASDPLQPGSIPLHNFKHELYARERALGQPITHAAERAGLGKRSGSGSKLEQNEDVRARIAWLAREEDEIVREKRRRLEERQWLIHDADVSKFYDVVEELATDGKGNAKLDAEGNQIVWRRQVPKVFEDLPEDLRPCVKALTYTDSGRPNLSLHDRQEASRELRKLLGLDAPTKIAPTTPDGEALSDDDALQELAAAMGDLAARLASLGEVEEEETE